MPAYAFEALDAQGQTRKGVLQADTERTARSQLRAQGLVPLTVSNVRTAPALQQEIWSANVFRLTALAVWTRQLASLVAAGLPLERALGALADDADTPRQRDLISNLRAEVNAGVSLGRALAQHPREFSPAFVAVVAAGEQGGQLGAVLTQLADELQAQHSLRQKLWAAGLYPAIVSLVACLIVLFLLSWVVPQVAQVFASQQRALPWLTRAMLALSGAVRDGWWLMAAVAVAAGVGLPMALRRAPAREAFDAAWLRLPLIGRLARDYNAARFAGTLGMLAQAGVPMLAALQTAANTLSNSAMRRDAEQALVLVREGASLAAALGQYPRLGRLLPLFTRLGEQTGTLAAMLQRAAHQLSDDVQRRAMQLATVLEPLLIVAMGAMVMLIVLAVMLPILDINQWVR